MTSEETNAWHKIDTFLMKTYGSHLVGMENDQRGDYTISIRQFSRRSPMLQVVVYDQLFRTIVASDEIPPDFIRQIQRAFSNDPAPVEAMP